MTILVTKRISDNDANKFIDPKYLPDSGYSQYVKIINNSSSSLSNVAIATLDYKEDPMWGDVINVPNIRPGASKTVDLTKKKLQLIEFKIKWYVSGVRYLHEQPHTTFGQWTYYTVAELTVDKFGYFMSVLRWLPV